MERESPGGVGGVGAQRLAIVDLEGNEEILVLGERQFSDLKWSPDGRSVVYESIPPGDIVNAHIYTYDVEAGARPRQLTFEGNNLRPVYSPDGTRVVFSSQREGTDGTDLFVKRLDDDAPAELLVRLPGSQFSTRWPSDTLIVFEWGPPPADLWMLDLSDPDNPKTAAYLEDEDWDLRGIVVSPDGTLAAYSSNETGIREVYVRSFLTQANGRQCQRVGGTSPAGHQTGTLSSTGPRGGEHTFLAARLQREPTPMVLSTDSLFARPYSGLPSDLHPDGDKFIFAQFVDVSATPDGASAEAERFILVTNWFEELRQRMGN